MTIRIAIRLLLRDIPCAAIGAIILLAIAINFANIIGRYVFLAPLPWAEEVLVFLVIWGVCVGASAVTYDNRHLDMNLFVGLFPPKMRAVLEVLKLATLVGFCAFTAVNAWSIVTLMARERPGKHHRRHTDDNSLRGVRGGLRLHRSGRRCGGNRTPPQPCVRAGT